MCYMGAAKRRSATVGVRELRQNLSIYLDRVKKGEALTVTEHGAAVAILRPLPAASSALERLVAEGRATRPSRSLRGLPRPLTAKLERPLGEILEELRAERV
jgi:prevent-host-death family protein